ncbi:uncharacterized protein LOC144405490 [Gasterosteus aculeatus]
MTYHMTPALKEVNLSQLPGFIVTLPFCNMRPCVVLFFAVSLLTLCEAQGIIVTPVFVLKGRDLLLKFDADLPERVLFVDWKINKTVTLNLQEADSGVHAAVAATFTGEKTLAEYKVTVQGPVSPVELIVDRVDSNSSESCDLHVTCRTHNSHINSTFRCDDRVCSQEGGERPEVTTSGASLQVYLLNSTIICNHSNQVHRTQDIDTAEHICSSNGKTERGKNNFWCRPLMTVKLLSFTPAG